MIWNLPNHHHPKLSNFIACSLPVLPLLFTIRFLASSAPIHFKQKMCRLHSVCFLYKGKEGWKHAHSFIGTLSMCKQGGSGTLIHMAKRHTLPLGRDIIEIIKDLHSGFCNHTTKL